METKRYEDGPLAGTSQFYTSRRFHVNHMWMVQALVWAGRRTGHTVHVQLDKHEHLLTLEPVSRYMGGGLTLFAPIEEATT
jgi:hypothetical protein